jgi:hypothetical protein
MASFLVLKREPTAPTGWLPEQLVDDLNADEAEEAIRRVVGPPLTPDRTSVERWRAVRWDNAVELMPVVTLEASPPDASE